MRALRIHSDDNVAVALEAIPAEAPVMVVGCVLRVTARDRIEFGHKIALEPVNVGSPIRKYGVPVGFATQLIRTGDWVHTHNVTSYFSARRETGER